MTTKYRTFVFLFLCFTPLFVEAQGVKNKQLNPVVAREMIRQWVKTESLISEEKNEWLLEKANMQELLGIYKKELALLQEEVQQAGTSAELLDGRSEQYKKELKQYQDARQLLKKTLLTLLPRVQVIVQRLPQSLQAEQKAEIALLMSKAAMESPREVLKSMLSVMGAAARFNRSATLVEEVRQVSENKKIVVDVLYLGLGRAFYVSNDNKQAGVGEPGAKSWEWVSQPDLASVIREAISVYKKEVPAKLLELPVQISNTTKTQK